jgi:hypothetical protein
MVSSATAAIISPCECQRNSGSEWDSRDGAAGESPGGVEQPNGPSPKVPDRGVKGTRTLI